MAITLVGHKADGTTGTNPTGALWAAATAGNMLVASLTHLGPGTGITAPAGWTTRYSTSGSPTVWIVEKVSTGGETSVTFTDIATVFYEIETYEFAGAAASSEFDAAAAGGSGLGQDGLPGTLTPAVSNEVFILAVAQAIGNGGSESIDSSFTILDNASFTKSVHGYKIKTDSTAENPGASWATTANWVAGMVAFKPSAGTTTAITPTGTVAPAGILLKTCGKALVGACTPAGVLRKTATKVWAGTVNPAGALTRALTHTFFLFLGGVLAPTGRVLRTVGKALVGLLAPSGSGRVGANPYVQTPTTVRGSSGTSSVTGPDGRSSTVEI